MLEMHFIILIRLFNDFNVILMGRRVGKGGCAWTSSGEALFFLQSGENG